MLTLIIVRRTPTEPKTAFAGVTLVTSFASFMASMAPSNNESVLSRRFCCPSFVSIAGAEGSCEKTVGRANCTKGPYE